MVCAPKPRGSGMPARSKVTIGIGSCPSTAADSRSTRVGTSQEPNAAAIAMTVSGARPVRGSRYGVDVRDPGPAQRERVEQGKRHGEATQPLRGGDQATPAVNAVAAAASPVTPQHDGCPAGDSELAPGDHATKMTAAPRAGAHRGRGAGSAPAPGLHSGGAGKAAAAGGGSGGGSGGGWGRGMGSGHGWRRGGAELPEEIPARRQQPGGVHRHRPEPFRGGPRSGRNTATCRWRRASGARPSTPGRPPGRRRGVASMDRARMRLGRSLVHRLAVPSLAWFDILQRRADRRR